MGYHKAKIKKGVIGEYSKVIEELLELRDAYLNNHYILGLVELSDIYGALLLFDKFTFHEGGTYIPHIEEYTVMICIQELLESNTRKETYSLMKQLCNIYGVSLDDVEDMARLTIGAFEDGTRKMEYIN